MEEALKEIHNYLEKRADCYPSGIPLRFSTARSAIVNKEDPKEVQNLHVAVITTSKITPEEKGFLDAIITKGMKLTVSDYTHFEANDGVLDLVLGQNPKVLLVFGDGNIKSELATCFNSQDGKFVDNTCFELSDSQVIGTSSLVEIKENAQYKKEFWKSLQGLTRG